MSGEHPGLDLTMGEVASLEELVDREALGEVCQSFFDLFGLPLRVFARDGSLLADVHEQRAICRYVNTLTQGRVACANTVGAVKGLDPEDGIVFHPCFTGAVYQVVPIEYQDRRIGRFVVGPYLPAERAEVPRTLLDIDPDLDPEKARARLTEMPRVRRETGERIARHLRAVLDLILFAGHRARLTSEMHIASVRESYRELAEKNANLQQTYDRLKELDRLKSNFLATISHELRTPLTSIIGYSEMLLADMAGPMNDEQKDFVNTIFTKGDHLLKLISSLLDLSKLEDGRIELHAEPIEPGALIREVAKTVTPQAQKKQIEVKSSVEDGLPILSGDVVRMRQILFNLADNALKFTPKGGQVYLGVRTDVFEPEATGDDDFGLVLMAAPKRAVTFSVRDTGIGIPAEEHEKVFDAFYQVDGSSTREHGGTGLGLSIVRRLAEAHGGQVRVESAVGEGTTFLVTLPEHESQA